MCLGLVTPRRGIMDSKPSSGEIRLESIFQEIERQRPALLRESLEYFVGKTLKLATLAPPDLTLPLPITDNRRLIPVRFKKTARFVSSADMSNYIREIQRITEYWQHDLDFNELTIDKPIYMLYKAYVDNLLRDSSNCTKVLKDSLERAEVYKNDRYVLPWCVGVEKDRIEPRIELWFIRL
jgi:Holliday junction resolvase RusA-like endonuclease